jgi:hypothetical protein
MANQIKVLLQDLEYRSLWLQYRLVAGRDGPKQKVLVNGSPKTGTTWMQRTLVSIPGYCYVGHTEGVIQRYDHVNPGDVIHAHEVFSPSLAQTLRDNEIRMVLMVRDPRDVVVSYMFHIRRDQFSPWQANMLALSYDEGILACIEGRPGLRSIAEHMQFSKSWLEQTFPFCCVCYEELNQNPIHEAQRVFQFLGIPLQAQFLRSVVNRNLFERRTIGRRIWTSGRKPGHENPNKFLRKGIVGDWKNYFNGNHVQRFKEVAGQLLIDLGYEKDLSW